MFIYFVIKYFKIWVVEILQKSIKCKNEFGQDYRKDILTGNLQKFTLYFFLVLFYLLQILLI
jgi:hypothetical protein